MFYVYILYNFVTHRYYVGYSPDLRNRLNQHLKGKVKSTKSNLNYKLAWYCAFTDKSPALEFERYLKSGSGVAFMKKRFLKSSIVALEKDNSLSSDF
jgi:predicted GIY-YIG superfamily endonuclease